MHLGEFIGKAVTEGRKSTLYCCVTRQPPPGYFAYINKRAIPMGVRRPKVTFNEYHSGLVAEAVIRSTISLSFRQSSLKIQCIPW